MIAPDYLVRHIPEPMIFLGERLRVVTLGHVLLLHRFGNRLVQPTQAAFDDLLMATFILSRDYETAIREMSEGKHVSWAREFPKRFKKKGFNIVEEEALLRGYIIEALEPPNMMFKTGHRSLGAPFEAILKLFLCQQMNLSATEAMDYPYSLAFFEYCVWVEGEGGGTLEMDEDKKAREKAIADFAAKHPEYA